MTWTKIALASLLSMFLFGCDRTNPNPESLDPIYADMQKDIASVHGELDAEKKQLEEFNKTLKAVVPQTGQIKFAQKRYFDSKAKIEKLEQQKAYLEMHLESRLKWDHEKYAEAYKKKEFWPDPKEFDEYLSQRSLERAPPVWNAKSRMPVQKETKSEKSKADAKIESKE